MRKLCVIFLFCLLIACKSQWSGIKRFGTSSGTDSFGIATDLSGNVYIAGITTQDPDSEAELEYSATFVIKYNSLGAKQWTKLLASSNGTAGKDITTDSSGNVYITGTTAGNLDGEKNSGGHDSFIVKYNSDGTKQWTKLLGTNDWDNGSGISTDSSGNFYITGFTNGNLDREANLGKPDAFVVKYNSDGAKQWTKLLGTGNPDEGKGITTDSSGNVYITGFTNGNLDGVKSPGNSDAFVVKYNSDGIKQWTKLLGTSNWDYGSGISTDSSGNVYITGETEGNLDGETNLGQSDAFVVKINPDGAKQWTKLFGTSDPDYVRSSTTDSSGNVYIAAVTDAKNGSATLDSFLVKYNSDGTKQWTKFLDPCDYGKGIDIATDSSGNVFITGTPASLDEQTMEGEGTFYLMKYNSDGVKQ